MRVCMDIQAAIAQRAGVGRYTKKLVEHLGPLRGADELSLFYFDFKRLGTPFPVAGARERALRWLPGRVVQQSWKRFGFPPFDWLAGRADVYHFPNFILPPLRRGCSVVTIHDVSFLRFPETMEDRNFAYMSTHIRDTVERADAIITDCQFVADEIEELLAVPEQKLFPIPLGLPPELRAPETGVVQAMRNRHQLYGPYLLHVGTLEPRKNHSFLLDVFDTLTKRGEFDGQLVCAGMPGWKCEDFLTRMRTHPRVIYLNYVPDDDLSALYAGAEAFLFPSLYEGFGFPPLEAMACGTPAICSGAGSLTEIVGGGATLVEAFDMDAWVEAVRAVLAHPNPCRGLDWVRQYTWAETARRTWEVYRSLA